jgi:serine/threonine protein phosphatase PrpC
VADELNHSDPDENDHEVTTTTSSLDNDIGDMTKRIERAFLITDIQSRMKGIQSSGATVCICLIKRIPLAPDGTQRTMIHAANVGDARAVVYHPGTELIDTSDETCTMRQPSTPPTFVSRLTKDHRANDPDEIRRIEKAGGFVFRDRVLGILAVSRSLGDHGLKDYVIAQPFQNRVDIIISGVDLSQSKSKEAFVILACDGVWDVFTDEEAVTFVLQTLADSGNTDKPKATKENVAEFLCCEAVRRGSADNVTAAIAWLG